MRARKHVRASMCARKHTAESGRLVSSPPPCVPVHPSSDRVVTYVSTLGFDRKSKGV